MEKLLLDTLNESRCGLPWVTQSGSKICVCLWVALCACVCIHVVFRLWCIYVCFCVDKSCLLSAPGQVTKVLFSSIPHECLFIINVFCFLFFFQEGNSNLFCSLSLQAARATDSVVEVGKLVKLRTKRDWQQLHEARVNFSQLFPGFSPACISRHEGGWIHFFKHVFSTRWWLT